MPQSLNPHADEHSKEAKVKVPRGCQACASMRSYRAVRGVVMVSN